MHVSDQQIAAFDDLLKFVHATFCESENLLADQFETRYQPLFSKGQLCAIEFSLRGPRSLRLAAIWVADQNVVLFYDARGERSLKVQLTSRVPLKELEARFAA